MVYKFKEDYNTYQRKWRRENTEKVKDIKHKSNMKNKHKIREYNKYYKQSKPWVHLLKAASTRCKKSGVPFSLTHEWGEMNWTGYCSLTGFKFNLEYSDKPGWKYLSPSIDRIDNSKGYEPDNCRFILNCINCFKGQMTDSQMIDIAKVLVEKYNG